MAKLNQENNFAFALIIFGKLGKSAKISLNSILKTGVTRICIAGDESGLNWIERHVSESQKHILCSHEIPKHDLLNLKLDLFSTNQYSIFGQERFIKLTTFKWYLLKSVLDTHDYLDYVIFSDLDVLWLKNPSLKHLKSNSLNHTTVVIQDDTPVGALEPHFCTGIMYWLNTDESTKILESLYSMQYHENLRGNLIPDEPTFNNWFRSMARPVNIELLNPGTFVIGHRFFQLLVSKNWPLKEVTAFHSNYVVGEKAKYRRLKTIELRMHQDWRWAFFYLREVVIKLFQKLFTLSTLK